MKYTKSRNFLKVLRTALSSRSPKEEETLKLDIRESMLPIGESLPRSLYLSVQQMLTEITGKAPRSLPPLLELKSAYRQYMSIVFSAIGILLTLASIQLAWWGTMLYLIAVLLISASLRTMQVSFTHYAAHGTLVTDSRINNILGEFYSILCLSTPMWMYKLSHLGGHHGRLNSVADPDASFFEAWGYTRGKSVKWYWWKTLRLALSPFYYYRHLEQRIKANFLPYSVPPVLTTTLPPKRTIISRLLAGMFFHLALAAIAFTSGYGLLYVLAYLIPLIFGFGLLSLFQNLSEHQAALVPGQDERLKGETKYTAGRFFGKTYDPDHRLRWWAHMILVSAPSKYLLVGNTELCSHDVHHAAEAKFFLLSDTRWAMAPYVRRDGVNQGAVFKESWGFKSCLEHSFRALSASD